VLLFLPGLVIGLTVHEFAHAFSARLLGDDLPKRQKRVSLNPLRHLSALGTLAILLLPFGWGKPVQVNIYNFRRPRRDYMISSLAGPAANLLVAGVLIAGMYLTRRSYAFGAGAAARMELAHALLQFMAIINIILAVVNLIPIPPLDGSKIWPVLFPQIKPASGQRRVWIFLVILVALVWTGRLQPAISYVIDRASLLMPASDAEMHDEMLRQGSRAYAAEDYERAEQCFTDALRYNPQSAEAYFDRAVTLQAADQPARALEDLNRAIELDATQADYYQARGDLLAEMGRLDAAAADWRKAAELRGPGDRPASGPATRPVTIPIPVL